MKLLHTSDWHLGMSFGPGISFEEDQRFFISAIEDIISREGVQALLIAGDIFDRSVANPEAIRLYDETMKHLCLDMGVKVLIVAGNHDGADRIASCHELLESSGLYVCGSLKAGQQPVELGDTDVYMLPWITTDRVRFAYPDRAEDINSMSDAYRVVLDDIRDKFRPDRRHICLAHAFVAGASTSVSDRSAEVGMATRIGGDLFEGFDYVALGHIHGPQDIGDHIRYSGTPMIYSFGKEEGQTKSVTLIDTDTMERKIIPVPALRERHTLTGTYDELLKADFPDRVRSGYVRLEVTDRFVGHGSAAELIDRYPGYLCMTCPNPELDRADITMTMDQLEEMQDDPGQVFERYCLEITGSEPSEHIMDLFMKACDAYGGEVNDL